ncbi:MAG: BtpA/SgcQ family protein [Candidatus Latescibacteria bacterium]|nr:BtpA/SgcQ family protein [Candidatus Latescibacterota bacterium]
MWNRATFRRLLPVPVIGMVHCRALPGAPGWEGDMAAVVAAALADARALADGGVGALMLENYHDIPFFPREVPAETTAALTRVAVTLRDACPDLPLGINVLRNDAHAALAVAAAVGAAFVRVNVLVGAAVTDQGLIEGRAAEVLRLRRQLAPGVGILADVRVKHAAPLAPRPLDDEVADLRRRGGADALIVSGSATGAAADPEELHAVRLAEPDAPLLVGSGLTARNAALYAPHCDGCIVGTSLQVAGTDGRRRIDAGRAAAFTSAFTAALAGAATEDGR